MKTCKDCIHYAVCCKYDMYGDCAKECKSFDGKDDWVKPVRCKDCVFWQDNNGGYPHQECRWGRGETPDPDDYCSFGESISEDYDMKIYDPKAQHINADLADRCNHGTRE